MNDLCQFFTPTWISEYLVERYFPKADLTTVFCEPTCGTGSILRAIPAGIRAYGVEIDPAVAEIARRETGRPVITGDFRTVELDFEPTAVIGNPPFRADVFDGILDRCHTLLPDGALAAFILPVYFFQTPSRVCRYNERWSIQQEMLPRHAFSVRMRSPLVVATFTKDQKRTLIGFVLYREANDLRGIAEVYREALRATSGSAWRAVCRVALERLGKRATLPEIYRELEGNRPSVTKFWREKIRQTLRQYGADFRAIATGHYELRVA